MNEEERVREASADTNDVSRLQALLSDRARFTARNPWSSLCTSLILSLILSATSLLLGDFSFEVQSIGWTTRGTTISDRMTASILLNRFSDYLRYGGEAAWIDMTTNIQGTWEYPREEKQYQKPKRLLRDVPGSRHLYEEESLEIHNLNDLLLRQKNSTDFLVRGCDEKAYFKPSFVQESRLWPVWGLRESADDGIQTLFHPKALLEICKAEEVTQTILETNDLCFGCEEGCLDPFSLVFIARLYVTGGMSLSCDDLSIEWESHYEAVSEQWRQCSMEILETKGTLVDALPESCPFGYSPTLVDEDFAYTGMLSFTSSIYATDPSRENISNMQEVLSLFGRGSGDLTFATYDTQQQHILRKVQDDAISADLVLALGAAAFITLAMMVHTKSIFIAFVGLLQIALSFPLSFGIYTLIGGYEFFPFFNFIGIYVVLALGADDVFVAMDKWKNTRMVEPEASVEEIASRALPDAASAMFLTTLTTALAFFATAICKVAPLRLFAIFVGLQVVLDYVLCILFIFPALCIYDNAVKRTMTKEGHPTSCLAIIGKGRHVSPIITANSNGEVTMGNVNTESKKKSQKESFIRRILRSYYSSLQRFRWVILAVCLAVLGVSLSYALTLELPSSLEIRLLPDSVEQEENTKHCFFGEATISKGLASSLGRTDNPYSFSNLVLDDEFDPSSEESQRFLLEFCDDLFVQDFAAETATEFPCPLQAFDKWLKNAPKNAPEACGDSTGLPVPQETFHSCVSTWANQTDEELFFFRNERLVAITLPFQVQVGPNDSYRTIRDEYLLIEQWMKEKMDEAPVGVERGFAISAIFWFYDTHEAMLSTAMQSAVIAIVASALVVLFACRSFLLTVFSCLSITFVLTTVTAIMVAMNWTLGFFESICFAILIGISADFVTHFSHAYASPQGEMPRRERTERALILMGPSVLASAFTTGASACVMLFTTIVFFQKFAIVLLFSILQSTFAAFVCYCLLTDIFGPSNPTAFIDGVLGSISSKTRDDDHASIGTASTTTSSTMDANDTEDPSTNI